MKVITIKGGEEALVVPLDLVEFIERSSDIITVFMKGREDPVEITCDSDSMAVVAFDSAVKQMEET